MTSLVYMHDDSHAKVWRAVIISLALHALVLAIYPTLSHIQLPEIPERLEIEFFSVKSPPPAASVQQVTPIAETPPEPVVVPKPQTTPKMETPKPVLAATDSHAEYRVAEQQAKPDPAKAEPAPPVVAPAPAATEASNQNAHQTTSEEHAGKDARPIASNSTSANNDSDELSASDTDAWGDYGEQLRAMVNKSKQYPTIAIRRHLEGEVTIVAQFTRGELTQVSLAETSKHVPLDEEAMRMVKKAIQQLGLKESLKKKSFKITIPVSFKLE